MKTIRLITILIWIVFFSVSSYGQYKRVNSKGLDVHYRVFGDGDPILIIGGGPGDDANRYLSLCELLSKNFKCILVDQRGTGKSSPTVFDSTTITVALTLDDFEAIRNHLGYKQWSVLGFSYGGFIASIYCNKFSSSISSLITLGSMGFDFKVFRYFSDNINSRLHSGDLELLKYWSDSTRAAINPKHAIVETIRAKMPGYFFDREKSLTVSQDMKDSDFDFEMGNWIWLDIEKNHMKFGETKSNFDKPVLILHGRQDPLGESVAINLSQFYKDSKLIFIEKCGHYSWVEQPEKVLSAIKDFMTNSRIR
ncbi:MAG: alpha/beta fold hydrolase [Tenuifilaceae bacterium]